MRINRNQTNMIEQTQTKQNEKPEAKAAPPAGDKINLKGNEDQGAKKRLKSLLGTKKGATPATGSGADIDRDAVQRSRENEANEAVTRPGVEEARGQAGKRLARGEVGDGGQASTRHDVEGGHRGAPAQGHGPAGGARGHLGEQSGPSKSLDGAASEGGIAYTTGGTWDELDGLLNVPKEGPQGDAAKSLEGLAKASQSGGRPGTFQSKMLKVALDQDNENAGGTKPPGSSGTDESKSDESGGTGESKPTESSTSASDKNKSHGERHQEKMKGMSPKERAELADKMQEKKENTPEGQKVDVQYKGKTFTTTGSKKEDGSDSTGMPSEPGMTPEEKAKFKSHLEKQTHYQAIKTEEKRKSEINPGTMTESEMGTGNAKLDAVDPIDYGEAGPPVIGSGQAANPGSDDINWGPDSTGGGGRTGPKQDLPKSLGPDKGFQGSLSTDETEESGDENTTEDEED